VRLLFISILLIMGLAGSLACTPAQRLDGQEPAPPAAPRRGGVFHLPISGTNANLNPYSSGGSLANLNNTIYEPLVARDLKLGERWIESGKVAPWLAERWDQPDQNTYIFSLRKDVTWHDGKPFTAEDVLHTFNYLKENRGKVTDAARVSNVQSVVATDPYSVRVTTAKPNPDFLRDDMIEIEVIPKHLLQEGKQLETSAIGTGAFRLKQFDKTAGWTVVSNDTYWRRGLPYLDGVAGHYMGDRGTMIAAFVAGEIDAMNPEDKVQFETVRGLKPDLKFDKFHGTYSNGLIFALDKPPYGDIRIRRAINLAVDRQDMVAKASFGDGIINPPVSYGWRKGWAMPQEELLKLPGFNPATKQQDIAEAKRLLAEAGYPNGFQAEVNFSAASTNPGPIAQVLASQLRPLGIALTLRPLDRASNAQAELDGAYELRVEGENGQNRRNLLDRLHSKGLLNKRGLNDPELDVLLERLVVEFNEDEAKRLHQQIQRRLYDQAYFISTFERTAYTVYQPWVYDLLHNYGANTVAYWTPPIVWMDGDQMPEKRRLEKP